MKIIFFGTPEFATPSLEILSRAPHIEVLAVVTQPDKPVGRKKTITPPPVKVLAKELKLKVLQPKNKKELEKELKDFKVDFFVVISYGMILTQKALDIPKLGAINAHASILPYYRGASPIQESLLHGDSETGITIMQMDLELDHGDILLTKKVIIEKEDDLPKLSTKLSQISAQILPLVLEDIQNGDLSPIPQNHSQASFCKKINKEDGKIDWQKTSAEIHNKLRAYTPWPGIHTEFADKKLKILELEASEEKVPSGKFLIKDKQLHIGTADGSVIIKKLQFEGKNPMNSAAFINGYKQLIEKAAS